MCLGWGQTGRPFASPTSLTQKMQEGKNCSNTPFLPQPYAGTGCA